MWGALGLAQLIWAYAVFKQGNHWQAVLGRTATDPPREARGYLCWLLSAPGNSPFVVALSHGRLGFLPMLGSARAYVCLRDVLVVDLSGIRCFALSFDETERALCGRRVWDSTNVERVLRMKPDQADKLRRMMAAAMPLATERPSSEG
jgi:hypothetical protein